MSLIVAARFQTFDQARVATAALRSSGIAPADITSFFVNPAGQHNLYPGGGDEYASPGLRHSGRVALVAAALGALLGAILGAVLYGGFGVPLIVALALPFVGAYTGSLIGALSSGRKGAAAGRAANAPPPWVSRDVGGASGGVRDRVEGGSLDGAGRSAAGDASRDGPGGATGDGADEGAARHSGVLVAVQVTSATHDLAARTLRAAGGQDLEKTQGEWRDGEWVDFDPLKPPLATR